MSAQQLNVEVIANNIANINTTSYKRSRAEFTDLFYQIDRMQGVPNRAGEAAVPEGKIGLGVRSVAAKAALRRVRWRRRATLRSCGERPRMVSDRRTNGETLYTRAGAFNTNADRQLVTADGYTVDPTIIIPQGTWRSPSTDRARCREAGPRSRPSGGSAQLTNFANEAGLDPLGGNPYRETLASGVAVVGVPGDPGYGKIQQGYLENSNVDPVKEITELISAQRSYEMNSKVVQAADDMASTISKGLR
jgi:flagellar basal-body rod protein FlgG